MGTHAGHINYHRRVPYIGLTCKKVVNAAYSCPSSSDYVQWSLVI